LDIKNGSTFITISWTAFHDHFKVSLVSSGPTQYIDTVARLTYHHNYFYNCGSRLPSLRFGKGHVYNNYFKDDDDAIHSRIGAWIRVEGNYFDNVGNAVATDDADGVGYVQVLDNHFGSSSVTSTPACVMPIPYSYTLDPIDSIPSIVTHSVRTTGVQDRIGVVYRYSLSNYPNPFNPSTTLEFSVAQKGLTVVKIYNIIGQQVAELFRGELAPGVTRAVTFDASRLASGVYFSTLESGSQRLVRKLLLLK